MLKLKSNSKHSLRFKLLLVSRNNNNNSYYNNSNNNNNNLMTVQIALRKLMMIIILMGFKTIAHKTFHSTISSFNSWVLIDLLTRIKTWWSNKPTNRWQSSRKGVNSDKNRSNNSDSLWARWRTKLKRWYRRSYMRARGLTLAVKTQSIKKLKINLKFWINSQMFLI